MTEVAQKLESFFKQYPTTSYAKNTIIIQSGSDNTFYYYVESGAVKMFTTIDDGRNLILHLFFPKSFFSLISLVSNDMHDYDFMTLRPTTLRKIPKSELLLFLESDKSVLLDVQNRLLRGLRGLLKRIEISALSSAHSQVAHLIYYFGQHLSESGTQSESIAQNMTIKITHQEIADWLGLSRENVSIQMKVLEQEGFITQQDHLIGIPNPEALKNVI